MSKDKQSNYISAEDRFEGEETLGAELKEQSNSSESDTEDKNRDEIYPDATVSIASESASVFQLKRKANKTPPLLKLDPDFQRETVWSSKQKSELIESILMGIPLPLIYVKEDEKGVYIIVDGRQRLTTLFGFMNHEFSLKNLNILKELNGAYFSETTKNGTKFSKHLEPNQQSKIEDCPLTLHVIKPPTADRVTFDLFDRVNRGGTRLNNQEMRNALYQGAATKLLQTLVNFDSFKAATENTIKPNRMKDKYLVLRMIGFYLWRKEQLLSVKDKGFPPVEYRSDLEDFLGKTMLFLNHQKGADFCVQFPALFDQTMQRCVSVLGIGCFRLPKIGDGPRRPISMSLFETVSYLMAESINLFPKKSSHTQKAFEDLLSNKEFIKSLTYTIDSNKSICRRFKIVETVIEEIRNA